VVFKPAELVPATAALLAEIYQEAGVPPGIFNMVVGRGREVGEAMVHAPELRAISFTGSNAVGGDLYVKTAKRGAKVTCEMGGKNAVIVMDDANLDLAVDGILWGAFGTTGQRCTATSRLLLQDRVHDQFVERLAARAVRLRLGDGTAPDTDVGPLISRPALDKVSAYIDVARAEGDEVITGGHPADGRGLERGFFFEPTILRGVRPGSRLACEEVFGPVLSVLRFSDLDEAIHINNEVDYGLSSSIYTRDVLAAFRALERLETGITYVNAPTIGAEAHLPFGGVKQTGNGHREGGWPVFDFYSETRVGYVDYSGKLQRAQIDTYDAAPY
jgi:aldehyde dehydrogenase (NAD+)